MAIDLQERLDNLRVKSGMLVGRYERLREQLASARETIESKEREIADMKRQISVLTRENEMLKVGRLVSPTRQDVEQSRAIISKLLRDIDKCISDLTE